MRAAELMTPDPVVVEPGTPIAEVAARLHEHDIGSVPVVESQREKRIVGVITDRDIAVRCTAAAHDPRACTADRHMTAEVVTARAGDDVHEVIRRMEGAMVRRMPVVDEDGRVLGIIAQADVAVDAVKDRAVSDLEVAELLEQISRPARPNRKPRRKREV